MADLWRAEVGGAAAGAVPVLKYEDIHIFLHGWSRRLHGVSKSDMEK